MKFLRYSSSAIALSFASVLFLGSEISEVSESVPEADAFLLTSTEHPQEWRTHGGTYAEQRYSTLTQIDEHNVSNLGLAWTFNTETTRGLDSALVDGGPVSLRERIRSATRSIEREAIVEALRKTQGNVTKAARQLGLSRRGLQLKMKELEIEREG